MRRILAGDDVAAFSPKVLLKHSITSASKAIQSHFDSVSASLEKGEKVKKAVQGKKIKASMHTLIATARMTGFQHGAKLSGKKMPALYGKEIRLKAETRSTKVQNLMQRTTRRTLKSNPDSSFTLSPERAMRASEYEASRAYYAGLDDALAGSGLMKAWATTSDNPCDDCLDNEDDDFIDVDDVFSSGHDYPPTHLNCGCTILVQR